MAETAPSSPDNADASRLQTLLTTFKQIGMPLLQALTDNPANKAAGGGAPVPANP